MNPGNPDSQGLSEISLRVSAKVIPGFPLEFLQRILQEFSKVVPPGFSSRSFPVLLPKFPMVFPPKFFLLGFLLEGFFRKFLVRRLFSVMLPECLFFVICSRFSPIFFSRVSFWIFFLEISVGSLADISQSSFHKFFQRFFQAFPCSDSPEIFKYFPGITLGIFPDFFLDNLLG